MADIENHDEYVAALKTVGLKDVQEIENGLATKLSAAVSLGSYRPATVTARK